MLLNPYYYFEASRSLPIDAVKLNNDIDTVGCKVLPGAKPPVSFYSKKQRFYILYTGSLRNVMDIDIDIDSAPVVGVHVHRKVESMNTSHYSVEEYMKWAEVYYQVGSIDSLIPFGTRSKCLITPFPLTIRSRTAYRGEILRAECM